MAFQQIQKGMDKDGGVHPISTDVQGRTKISHGQPDAISGTIDALNSAVALSSDGFSDAVFYFTPLGSHVITFEQSPNSTNGVNGAWFTTLAQDQNTVSNSTVSTTLTTTAKVFRVSAPAGAWIRARVSTMTTAGVISVLATTTTAFAQPQLSTTISGTLGVTQYPNPNTGAGGTTTPYLALALTAKAAIKTGAGSVLHINAYNPNATDSYIQFFNTALASVTVGTTVPIRSYRVPANSTIDIDFATYQRYTTAITIAPWSVAGNATGTAPSVGLLVNVDYV